jgi:alpha-galactosidase
VKNRKVVIIGAGSIAFTPALLAGFSADPRYRGAVLAMVDVNEEALSLVSRYAQRVSEEFDMDWTIEGSTDRRDVLPGAQVVTAAIGVGGLDAWVMDVEIPARYGFIQPVGDTSGPGGLARALRHIPVLVAIGRDMETLCPDAVLYNFTNPLTVLTQAVSKVTRAKCVGLCIGPDLTWDHLCRVIGVEKTRTQAVIGGINHCHWVLDFRVDGQDGFPLLSAALDELDGDPARMEAFRKMYEGLNKRPQEPHGGQPLCVTLYRQLGYYPGPGDGHVIEFFPQFTQSFLPQFGPHFQGEAIANVQRTYPVLAEKMQAIAAGAAPIDTESFAREMYWEHTQLLDILVSQEDNQGRVFYVNIPNQGYIHNLPDGVVVEIPVVADASGMHPFALGDLPQTILPTVAHKVASLDLILEAAMEGSRRKAVQALINDPYCTDINAAELCVNALIEAELAYLPNFRQHG